MPEPQPAPAPQPAPEPAPASAPASTEKPIDVKDLSMGDLFAVFKRLKVTSVIWVIGTLIAAFTAVIGFVRKVDDARYSKAVSSLQQQLSTEKGKLDSIAAFEHFYVTRFSDRSTLQKILPSILQERPDGVTSTEEALECLLWQVRSQHGFAEFLSGTQSVTMQLKPDSSSIGFDWQHRTSVLVTIFENLNLSVDKHELAQHNAELNFFGMTWLRDGSTIVRDETGGLEVVK